jgi:hypothetical protein
LVVLQKRPPGDEPGGLFRVLDAGQADLGVASRAADAGSNDRGQRDKRENDRKNLFHDADLDGNLPSEMHAVPKGCPRINVLVSTG